MGITWIFGLEALEISAVMGRNRRRRKCASMGLVAMVQEILVRKWQLSSRLPTEKLPKDNTGAF